MELFDTVKIKETGEVGFISCIIDEDRVAVNTGIDDNQPVINRKDLELMGD